MFAHTINRVSAVTAEKRTRKRGATCAIKLSLAVVIEYRTTAALGLDSRGASQWDLSINDEISAWALLNNRPSASWPNTWTEGRRRAASPPVNRAKARSGTYTSVSSPSVAPRNTAGTTPVTVAAWPSTNTG